MLILCCRSNSKSPQNITCRHQNAFEGLLRRWLGGEGRGLTVPEVPQPLFESITFIAAGPGAPTLAQQGILGLLLHLAPRPSPRGCVYAIS
ncbi:hypothetical protein E2C01_030258 [Portunus trituberculatus]|uniref:Uncharacterized protein n=1 Tax=Portunus trituberculatus TaxID=210409 RepID=A0A5B7EPZ4_PORTR|nr:hypothetical protein [Portunus trituberculatus]